MNLLSKFMLILIIVECSILKLFYVRLLCCYKQLIVLIPFQNIIMTNRNN